MQKKDNMMKTTLRIRKTFVLGVFLSLAASLHAAEKGGLADGFENPPGKYRSIVLWEWCNGWISKEAMTKEMESLKRVGLGGAKVFNVGGPEGPVRFASPEWFDIFGHTLREASRLDLKISMNMTEGFCAIGGPWIPPEMSMQHMVWSETEVAGPGKISIELERPDDGPIEAKTLKLKDVGYYKDYRVVAVPQVAKDQIPNLGVKKGLREHHAKNETAGKKAKAGSVQAADIIPQGKVIDLTDKMDESGKLTWNAPAGKWTILRMGSASTGACTRPGNEKTRGLEADKFSRKAVKLHFDSLIKPILEQDGVKPGENFTYLAVDSWEADGQNWSPVLAEEFEKRRGYSLYPFLPVLTGRIVESVEVSERFLYDFRRTMGDCVHDNFFGYLVELCAEYNMGFGSEPFSRAAFDGMEIIEALTHPCATFWNRGSHFRAYNESKWAASPAHVLGGGRKVTSEAFPAGRFDAAWVNYPWTYKWLADYAYTAGLTQLGYHCSPIQPWDDKPIHKPGMVFKYWGSQYSRHNTWWEQGAEWQKYQTRCQYMLEQGQFQGEALFMTPETIPGQEGSTRPNLPQGYDFDLVSAKLVRNQLSVEDGMILAPSGLKYHLLNLPRMSDISVELLKKIQKLVADGAQIVVSSKPTTSKGLVNYPASENEVRKLVAEIWQGLNGDSVTEVSYGKGTLYWLEPLDVLKKLGVQPDVIVEMEDATEETSSYRAKLPLTYIHRKTADEDFYFVASSLEKPASALLSFRISGKQPEFWHPESGRIEPCPVYEEKDGRTIIPLVLDPAGSLFVVFRGKPEAAPVTQVSLNGTEVLSTAKRINPLADSRKFFKAGGSLEIKTANGRTLKTNIASEKSLSLDTGWKVSFDGVAAPKARTFETLTPWNESDDDLLRYFSGTGIYKKTINVKKKKGEELWLDLGLVEVIATVLVNGKEVATEWKPPFLLELTDALKSGRNELEIRVTNLWGNRFIGDEQYPDDIGFGGSGVLGTLPDWFVEDKPRPQPGRKTFTTCRYYAKDDPLKPSGLLGPVSLIARSKQTDARVDQIARDLFVFSRNPEFFTYGWHRVAPYWKDVARKQDKNKAKYQKKPADAHGEPEKKPAAKVNPAPVSQSAPAGKYAPRKWAAGSKWETTASFVRTFDHPSGKKVVALRTSDGKESLIGTRNLTKEDRAYLESIQMRIK